MSRTLVCTLLAATTLALAPSARAQLVSPIHVGVSGGVSFPTSEGADLTAQGFGTQKQKQGYNINGLLSLQVPLFPVGLRAEVGYDKFNSDQKSTSQGGGTDVGILSGSLNAIFQTTGVIIARPYLIGGVGMYRVRQTVRVSQEGVAIGEDNSKTSVGFNGGVGIHFGFAGLGAFAEARYHYVMNDRTCTDSDGSSGACFSRKNTAFVPVSVGIMF